MDTRTNTGAGRLSPLHSAARVYAQAGIPVFPCWPGTKKPMTASGFHDATDNLTQIDMWWTATPDANIAFTPHSVGWGIVDIDSPEAEIEFGIASKDDPETWVVRTPRGGLHLYYQGELPTSVARRVIPGQKIDTRGRGSYALLPPSRTEHGTYEAVTTCDVAPLPAWISAAIAETAGGPALHVNVPVDLDQPANVARAKEYLERAEPAIEGQGGNERTFVVACAMRDMGISEELAAEIMEPWNDRCLPPWLPDELAEVIANAYHYAQNDPGVHALGSTIAETFGTALAALPKEPLQKRSRFYPEDETEQEDGAEPTWVIPSLLPDSASVMLYGPTQSYKSFLALDLALSIAANSPTFAGAPLRHGPVFYAALEGRTDLKKKRRRAWKLARQVDAVPAFYVMPAPMVVLAEEVAEFKQQIRARLAGRSCAGIVLDTLAKAMVGLNENDAKDAGQFIMFVDDLKETFGCPVMVLHHTGKDEAKARGSSSFHAGFDTVIKVTANRDTRMLTVEVEKHKDAVEPEPWYLEGKAVAQSLVFQPVSKAEHAAATQAESLYTHKKIAAALRALGALGEDHAVTAHVLASKLVPQIEGEDVAARDKKVASTARILAKLAKGSLEAYAIDGAWSLPAN